MKGNLNRTKNPNVPLYRYENETRKEVRGIIVIARTRFTNMRTLLSCRCIHLKTRLRAITCYGRHCSMEQRQDTYKISLLSFDIMWIYRRVVKLSCTEKITNEEAVRRTIVWQSISHTRRHFDKIRRIM